MLTEDLIRANINAADKAVVLGHDMSSDKRGAQENDQMIDAESIFIYKAIKKCNKNVQIMIELGKLEMCRIHLTFMKFMLQTSNFSFQKKRETKGNKMKI